MDEVCKGCNGTGKIGDFLCPMCGGDGRMTKAKQKGIDIDEEFDRA